MTRLKSYALSACLALGLASPASAAQILLSGASIIGGYGHGNHAAAFDQQTGDVSLAGNRWVSTFGATIFVDLGQAYDLGSFDLFAQSGGGFEILGGNSVTRDPWAGWVFNEGGTLLSSGMLAVDGGDASGKLTAQTYADTSGSGAFRYLAIRLPAYQGGSRTDFSLNEVRVFTAVPNSAVPEPATWAMLIGGFGLAGAALRRHRAQTAMA